MLKDYNNLLGPRYADDFNPVNKNPLIDSRDFIPSLKYPYAYENRLALETSATTVPNGRIVVKNLKNLPVYKFPADGIISDQHDKKFISGNIEEYKEANEGQDDSTFLYYFVAHEDKSLNNTPRYEINLDAYENLGGILRRIRWANRIFELNEDLCISIRYSENIWFHEHEELGIYANGSTVSESLTNFQAQFDAAWTYYGLEDDNYLTSDAQDLKILLRELVSKVVEVD